MCGFAEQLAFFDTLEGHREEQKRYMEKAARATCDSKSRKQPPDGHSYWDTGRARTGAACEAVARRRSIQRDEPVEQLRRARSAAQVCCASGRRLKAIDIGSPD